MHKLFFIIGASCSGKTTAAKLAEKELKDFKIFFFDSIGVPSPKEMIKEFGSGENWQIQMTFKWTRRIKRDFLRSFDVILDGQINPNFIDKACKNSKINNYEIILFDCSDEVRMQRLKIRSPELANTRMLNWASYLRKECSARKCKIIDTSKPTIDQSAKELIRLIRNEL